MQVRFKTDFSSTRIPRLSSETRCSTIPTSSPRQATLTTPFSLVSTVSPSFPPEDVVTDDSCADTKKELVVGLIDTLGVFNALKMLENAGKTALKKATASDADAVTVIPPSDYASRFRAGTSSRSFLRDALTFMTHSNGAVLCQRPREVLSPSRRCSDESRPPSLFHPVNPSRT